MVDPYLFLVTVAGVFATGFLAAGFLAGEVAFLGFVSAAGFGAGLAAVLAGAFFAGVVFGLAAVALIGGLNAVSRFFLVAALLAAVATVFLMTVLETGFAAVLAAGLVVVLVVVLDDAFSTAAFLSRLAARFLVIASFLIRASR